MAGILTNRDMRFVSPCEKPTTLVRDVMTKAPLMTALEGIDPDDAVAIFAQHKIEKLPLVDSAGRLRGEPDHLRESTCDRTLPGTTQSASS